MLASLDERGQARRRARRPAAGSRPGRRPRPL